MTNGYDVAGRVSSSATNRDGVAHTAYFGYDADGNQIRLSAAESSRLVSWAETFRGCMLTKGVSLVKNGGR